MDSRLSLTALQQSGALSSVDVHLSELVSRLTKESRPEVKLAMALASQWPQRGHVCADLQSLKTENLWESQEYAPPEGSIELPPFDSLQDSEAIGGPDDHTPFVLWQDRWLYLRRYWDYECELVTGLRAWLDQSDLPIFEPHVKELIAHLYGADTLDESDHQQQAALLASKSPFFILTGGPGTGKTTTVLRILALLLNLNPDLQIALAAPTGKAALRLQESIALGLNDLPCDEAIKAKMPQAAQTLHRLLGYRRNKTTFRHNAEHPLPHDLVVVDEASMMDLGLMAKLMRALRPGARLILIGDREQLPSVDAGAVFGTLCAQGSPMPRVELTRNYRFSQDTGIGALATAIRQGDADTSEHLLTETEDASCLLEPLPAPNQMLEALWLELQDFLRKLAESFEPEDAFAHLETLRVLCAHRTGPFGSEAINELVHDLLGSRLRIPRSQRWFPGRPILITENDYAVELFNGDTGMILPWKGKLHAFFRSGDGSFRHIAPARLPAHESAYAMTVHKSQGSEFDEVLFILTDQPSRLLTRELLYTGITRARSRVRIWSPSECLRACVERPMERTSGLPAWFESWEDTINPSTPQTVI
jgi:exodeoxyribonuclease V alpha subunit